MFEDNFNISQLFVTKTVTVTIDKKSRFKIIVPTIKDFYEDPQFNSMYHLWTGESKDIQKVLKVDNSFALTTTVIFKFGGYSKYMQIADSMRNVIAKILPESNVDMASHRITVNGITMTEEIWDYILYILKLSCGEKATKPLTFDSEQERKFYEAQKAVDAKIAKIRNKNSKSKDDNLAKILLYITYAFPSITIDYLINQTMAQIRWLQKYAAGAVSYEVSAQALAAGNMKKGKKLDFFIKF